MKDKNKKVLSQKNLFFSLQLLRIFSFPHFSKIKKKKNKNKKKTVYAKLYGLLFRKNNIIFAFKTRLKTCFYKKKITKYNRENI